MDDIDLADARRTVDDRFEEAKRQLTDQADRIARLEGQITDLLKR